MIPQTAKSLLKMLFKWVGIIAIGGSLGSLLGACNQSGVVSSTTVSASDPSSTIEPTSTIEIRDQALSTDEDLTPAISTSSDEYQEGIDLASSAYLLGLEAQSTDDWDLVVNRWSRAIQIFQLVPDSSPHYDTVQSKIPEYQRNLAYAQQQLRSLNNPPDVVPLVSSPVTLPGTSESAAHENAPAQSNHQDSYRVPILRRQGGTPVIEVTFNGVERFPMILDTGASHTHITRQMASRLGVVPIGQTQAATASNNNVIFDVGRIDSIEVANIRRTNISVSIGDSVDIGLLGNDVYRDYDIILLAQAVEFRRR